MKRTPTKRKLDLGRETIRQIGSLELGAAHGGRAAAIALDTGADTVCPLPQAATLFSCACG